MTKPLTTNTRQGIHYEKPRPTKSNRALFRYDLLL